MYNILLHFPPHPTLVVSCVFPVLIMFLYIVPLSTPCHIYFLDLWISIRNRYNYWLKFGAYFSSYTLVLMYNLSLIFSCVISDILMEVIKKVTVNPTIPANLLTSIRAVTNLFRNLCYYNWLQKHRSEVSISLLQFFNLEFLKDLKNFLELEDWH